MKTLQEYLLEAYNALTVYSNAVVLTADKQYVLIVHRSNKNDKFIGLWAFPGGTQEPKDFTSKNAMLRELKEETGITLNWDEESRAKLLDTVKHSATEKSEYWLVVLDSAEPVKVKLSDEHKAFEWFELDSTKQHKWVPEVYPIIQQVLARVSDDQFWKIHKYFEGDAKGYAEFKSWVDKFKKSKYVNINELKNLLKDTTIDIKALVDFVNDTIVADNSVTIDYTYQIKKILEQIINYQG